MRVDKIECMDGSFQSALCFSKEFVLKRGGQKARLVPPGGARGCPPSIRSSLGQVVPGSLLHCAHPPKTLVSQPSKIRKCLVVLERELQHERNRGRETSNGMQGQVLFFFSSPSFFSFLFVHTLLSRLSPTPCYKIELLQGEG